jgi:hypothetical protein
MAVRSLSRNSGLMSVANVTASVGVSVMVLPPKVDAPTLSRLLLHVQGMHPEPSTGLSQVAAPARTRSLVGATVIALLALSGAANRAAGLAGGGGVWIGYWRETVSDVA